MPKRISLVQTVTVLTGAVWRIFYSLTKKHPVHALKRMAAPEGIAAAALCAVGYSTILAAAILNQFINGGG